MLNHSREVKNEADVIGNTLEDNRELLNAKRKGERILSYKFLIKSLSEDYQNKFLENSCETLFESIINSCKKGDTEEKCLAITLSAILFLSIEQERVDEFWESTNLLLTDILKTSKDNLKSIAASALTISCVLADSTSAENLEKLSSLIFENLKSSYDQLGNKDHQPLILILRSWAFLISMIKPTVVEEKYFVNSVEFIVQLLDDNNIQVRLTAAETLVMLLETVKSVSDEDTEFDLGDYQNVFDIDQVLETLKNKNGKVEISMRRKFERIVEVLESNLEEGINTDFTGNFTQIKIDSWSQFVQFEFFIELVGKGLVTHFSRNSSLKRFLGNQKNIQSVDHKSIQKN